jgi:hypothetical protein
MDYPVDSLPLLKQKEDVGFHSKEKATSALLSLKRRQGSIDSGKVTPD